MAWGGHGHPKFGAGHPSGHPKMDGLIFNNYILFVSYLLLNTNDSDSDTGLRKGC